MRPDDIETEAVATENIDTKEQRPHIYAQWFKDDGRSTNTAYIQEAHDFAQNQGYSKAVIHPVDGVYTPRQAAEIDIDIKIQGQGSTLKLPDGQQKRNLTSDASSSDTTIDLDDVSGLEAGDELFFYDDNKTINDGEGVHRVIDSVGSSSVTLKNQLGISLSTSANAAAIHLFYVFDVKSSGRLEVWNLECDGNQTNYNGPTGGDANWVGKLTLYRADDPNSSKVINCRAKDWPTTFCEIRGPEGIMRDNTVISAEEGVHVGNGEATIVNNRFEDCNVGIHTSTGIFGNRMSGNEFINCFQGINGISNDDATKTPSLIDERHIITWNYFEDIQEKVLDTGSFARYVTFSNNMVYNANTNDSLSGVKASVCHFYDDPLGVDIEGNVIIDDQSTPTTFNTAAITVQGPKGTVNVRGNTLVAWDADGNEDYAIWCWQDGGAGRANVTNNTTWGDFERHITIDCDGNYSNNALLAQDKTSNAGFRLRDEFKNGRIADNDYEGNVMMTLDAGADPDEFIITNNRPRIEIDLTGFTSVVSGSQANHDGSGVGLAGPARHDGSNWFYEAGVTESANAETPQGSYQSGQIVYFTDSGDGSGDGTYIIDDSQNPQGPV
jgi:hypothetical protein